MYLEIDEAAVNSEDWVAAKAGDQLAKDRIRAALRGVSLYFHNLTVTAGEERVNLRDLYAAGCIDGVTIEIHSPRGSAPASQR